MMKRIFIAMLVFHGFMATGQCDLAITDFNSTTGDLVVEVINSENCGCNDFTNIETTCEGSASGALQNNETISHIVLGLHLDGFDYQWTDCVSGNNHPGWTFKNKSFFGNSVLETGDTWNTNIYDFWSPTNECWADILANNEGCAELVIWQINLSQTSEVADGGWAVNPNIANQTQNYPDLNVWNNSTLQCPPPPAPDAIVTNIEIQTGCIGDLPVYNVEYTVINIGEEPITEYCIELWNEDYYQCFDSDLFGNYEIPPGEGQVFTTQFFEFTGIPGGFFVISVDGVNDEIVTGNNNTTVYYPDEWEVCPIECEPDTIIEYVDNFITDTIYVELPNDTIIEYVDNFITDTIYVETIDTVYVDVEVFVEVFITDTITEIEYITEYVTDTLFITTVDTVEVIVYEFLTDTIYEYITIDCETGLECIDDPGLTCPDWTSVYLPNTFTPNGDGLNDTWKMVYDLDCWVDVEFKIFNRWGGMIYSGMGDYFDSYPYWDGSVNGGDHYASDGVYTYTFYARKLNSTEIFERHGHITIFR